MALLRVRSDYSRRSLRTLLVLRVQIVFKFHPENLKVFSVFCSNSNSTFFIHLLRGSLPTRLSKMYALVFITVSCSDEYIIFWLKDSNFLHSYPQKIGGACCLNASTIATVGDTRRRRLETGSAVYSSNLLRGDSFEAYVCDLRNKVSTCQLGALKDDMICDTSIISFTDQVQNG